jgi:DedD protein
MALFSTRAKPASQSASNAQSSTVLSNEEFKRRAKNRLIGSFVLVVLAVIGFTWLLDSQPRPAINDVPVIIPSRENAPAWSEPVVTGSAVAGAASNASAAVGTASLPNNTATHATRASSVPHLNSMANLPASSSVANQLASSNSKPSASTAVVAASKPTAANTAGKTASSSKFAEAAAVALTAKEKEKKQEQELARKKEELFTNAAKLPNKDKTNTEAAANGQFVIQVGAYADANKAKEIKSKLEAVGLSAYTQNVKNGGVSLIRVRVGPYASKAAAEQHVGKIKALNLSAIVTNK